MPTKQTFKNIAGKFFTVTFKDFVAPFTFTFTPSSTYDPITGAYSDLGTSQILSCIRLNHETRQYDGERIRIGDVKLISRYDDWNTLGVVPQVEDTTVVIDGDNYQIVDRQLDAADALYTMNCRRL